MKGYHISGLGVCEGTGPLCAAVRVLVFDVRDP